MQACPLSEAVLSSARGAPPAGAGRPRRHPAVEAVALPRRPPFAGGLRLSPHHPRESAVSLTTEVRCGYAEGSLSGRGCEGCDLGAAGGGGERGRDRPAARDAEADGE